MIDEEKLIEDILKHSNNITSEWETAGILNLINQQPKVGEWISVEERLPDESFEELEWIRDEEGKAISCDVLVTFISESENGKRYVVDSMYFPELPWNEGFAVNGVIAWMPLPEPYDMRKKVE